VVGVDIGGMGVEVGVGVDVGVSVGVGVGVLVGVRVGVSVGDGTGVLVSVGSGATVVGTNVATTDVGVRVITATAQYGVGEGKTAPAIRDKGLRNMQLRAMITNSEATMATIRSRRSTADGCPLPSATALARANPAFASL